MRFITTAITLLTGIILGAAFSVAFAWNGPTGTAPANNVSAPINVGSTPQNKNGNLGVNALVVFGDSLFSGLVAGTGRYLNFDYTVNGTSGVGAAGYGIRDNAGTLEFKNRGGAWASFLGSATQWQTSGSNIYYTARNVGVGTVPSYPLHVLNSTNTAIDGVGPTTGSSFYGVVGSGGSYYGALGRADGFNGTLYNNGGVMITGATTIQGRTLHPICVGTNYSDAGGSKAYLFPDQTSCTAGGFTTQFVFYAYY